jgi:DNA adenine methylase
MIRRPGNKTKLTADIVPLFAPHTAYIELFCGAGGMFLNKPKARYNFLNDIDNDVYNCFKVLQENKEALENYIRFMPCHETYFKECMKKQTTEPIQRAAEFLFLSNFSLYGIGNTLRFGQYNTKELLIENIEKTYLFIIDRCQFMNCDFRNVIKKIRISDENKASTFVYSDPPYLGTSHNYDCPEWTESDVIDCFDVTFDSGINGAMSEFAHPFIIDQAQKRKLNIVNIGERQSIKNRNTEILITNYKNYPTLWG